MYSFLVLHNDGVVDSNYSNEIFSTWYAKISHIKQRILFKQNFWRNHHWKKKIWFLFRWKYNNFHWIIPFSVFNFSWKLQNYTLNIYFKLNNGKLLIYVINFIEPKPETGAYSVQRTTLWYFQFQHIFIAGINYRS